MVQRRNLHEVWAGRSYEVDAFHGGTPFPNLLPI
jgi:hypothetical protein